MKKNDTLVELKHEAFDFVSKNLSIYDYYFFKRFGIIPSDLTNYDLKTKDFVNKFKDELIKNHDFVLIKINGFYDYDSQNINSKKTKIKKNIKLTQSVLINVTKRIIVFIESGRTNYYYCDNIGYDYITNVLIPSESKWIITSTPSPRLKMLINTPNGIMTDVFDINEYNLDYDNYNDGFDKVDLKVNNFINNTKSGLILFHGKPGTGKTSYIRNLITKNPNLSFIYIPADMIDIIISPNFLPTIMENINSILILEDCERLISDRQNHMSSMGISNILNMTDGLLSDCLKMKIIATFNCDVDKIDPALRRPGRLAYQYEFDYLSYDRVKKLFKKNKIKKEVDNNKKYSLADIYADIDIGTDTFIKKKQSFGFSLSDVKTHEYNNSIKTPKNNYD